MHAVCERVCYPLHRWRKDGKFQLCDVITLTARFLRGLAHSCLISPIVDVKGKACDGFACACVMCTCMRCVCVHVLGWHWISSSIALYFTGAGFFTRPERSLIWLGFAQSSLSLPPVCRTLSFYVDPRDPNPGLRACIVSALSTELSPQPERIV